MMALPLFFSIIALAIVSTTTLIIVRNRVRLGNISASSKAHRLENDAQMARKNAALSSLVQNINANTTANNEFAKRTDRSFNRLHKDTDVRMKNMNKRLNSFQNLNTANFMGMNNRVDKEIHRLDAVDDIIRDQIANERRERIAQDQTLDGLILNNTRTHAEFVSDDYVPFQLQTFSSFQNAQSNMNRIESEYRRDDKLLSEKMGSNERDMTTKMERMNADLNERIQQVQDNVNTAVFDSMAMDSNQFTLFSNMITQQDRNTNKNLNNFFEHDTMIFSPNYNVATGFDDWARSKYYSSNQRRELLNLQDTIDRTEDHIRNINDHDDRIGALERRSDTGSSNFSRLQENIELMRTKMSTENDAIQSNLLIHESRINRMEEGMDEMSSLSDVNAVRSEFNVFKTDTKNDIQALNTRVYSNIEAQFSRTRANIASNDTRITELGGSVADLSDEVSDIRSSLESKSNSDTGDAGPISMPSSGITLADRPWRTAWNSEVEQIAGNLIENNNRNLPETLKANPVFGSNVTELIDANTDVLKKNQLDTVFSERILPTIKADYADLNGVVASNVTVGGTLDVTDLNLYGGLTIKREDKQIDLSLDQMYSDINTNTFDINTLRNTVNSAFDIRTNNPFTGASSDIGMVDDVSVKGHLAIKPGKNLILASDPDEYRDGYMGGDLIVSDFDNIKYYDNRNKTYTTLREELNTAKTGATAPDLAAQLNGERIDTLYTGTCDQNNRNSDKSCITIENRLTNLEDSQNAPSSAPSSPAIDLSNLNELTSLVVTPPGNNEMIYDTNGLVVYGDAEFNRKATFNSDATFNGEVSVNNLKLIDDPTIKGDAQFQGQVTFSKKPILENGLQLDDTDLTEKLKTIDSNLDTLKNLKHVTDIRLEHDKLKVRYNNSYNEEDAIPLPKEDSSVGGALTSFEENDTHDTLRFLRGDFSGYEVDVPKHVPKEIVTNVAFENDKLSVETHNRKTRQSNVSNIEIITSPPYQETIRIGGKADNEAVWLKVVHDRKIDKRVLQVCQTGGDGTCSPIWDHNQAPLPAKSSSAA